jgi:voltage-gated potassium channel
MLQNRNTERRGTGNGPAEAQPENNFIFFLAGLLLILFMLPAINWLSSGRAAFALLLVFLSGTLVLASWTLRIKPRLFLTGIIVSAVAFLLSIAALATGSKLIGCWSLAANITFWCLGVWIAGVHMLSFGQVTLNRITGSICVYMMVAHIFALLNLLIERVFPGSFTNLSATTFTEQLPEFLYYSYATLNTLGYGDISPVGSLARIAAILESTFGVFYLAILVASLVAMYLKHHSPEATDQHRLASAAKKEGTDASIRMKEREQ